MKRSNAPVFWLLFGAGGMLSALIGAALVAVTGLLVPVDRLSYPRILGLAQHPIGKAFLFAVIALLAWHAAHRIFHSLHDLGLKTGAPAKAVCYGGALLVTLVSAAALLRIGL